MAERMGGIYDVFKYRGQLPPWVLAEVKEEGASYLDFSESRKYSRK